MNNKRKKQNRFDNQDEKEKLEKKDFQYKDIENAGSID